MINGLHLIILVVYILHITRLYDKLNQAKDDLSIYKNEALQKSAELNDARKDATLFKNDLKKKFRIELKKAIKGFSCDRCGATPKVLEEWRETFMVEKSD